MEQYLNLCRHILDHGSKRMDRTGVGTLSVFGYQMRFDLNEGFPLLTTKKLNFKNIAYELLWFLKGETNNHYLFHNGVHIWDQWANEWGDLGPIYGKQWRSWQIYDNGAFDQIATVINTIKNNPTSRRMIVSAWNVADLPVMALPPCHALFQFYVTGDDRLSCQLYQRSGDVFLGVPYNIASYALLTHIIARITDLQPGEFIHTLGDAHIYTNHLDQVNLQITRKPMNLPYLWINNELKSIDDLEYQDIVLTSYVAHPHIKGDVAI